MIDGLTGTVKFDTDGKRSYIAVQILQLNPHGLTPIGMWNSDAGLTISREPEPPPTGIDNEAVRNRTFIVLTSLVRIINFIFILFLELRLIKFFYLYSVPTVRNA